MLWYLARSCYISLLPECSPSLSLTHFLTISYLTPLLLLCSCRCCCRCRWRSTDGGRTAGNILQNKKIENERTVNGLPSRSTPATYQAGGSGTTGSGGSRGGALGDLRYSARLWGGSLKAWSMRRSQQWESAFGPEEVVLPADDWSVCTLLEKTREGGSVYRYRFGLKVREGEGGGERGRDEME